MVCYPKVQRNAQEELDRVLDGRLPEHSDFFSLPYLLALVKEVYRYASVCFEYPLLSIYYVFRWQPVTPLGRVLFVSNILTGWLGHPCLFKAPRISRPAMISTTIIISPPTLLWFPTNGDSHLPLLNIELSSLLNLCYVGRCWTTNGSIQNHTNSSPSAFWRMDSSTVQ